MLRRLAVLLLLLAEATVYSHGSTIDYWTDNFDLGANCKQKELIAKLVANKDDRHCESSMEEDNQQAFQNCKIKLSRLLLHHCALTAVENAGELMYCRMRGALQCCFNKHSCTPDWTTINNMESTGAVGDFLENPEKILKEITKEGYKACHRIEGYDVSKCADDCKVEANREFAKNCTDGGGFFKCCIRRDKIGCHECRFCCSLPMCSMDNGRDISFHGINSMDEKDQAFQLGAIDKFTHLSGMYKAFDYRCLKPIEERDSITWPHYIHEDFKKAMSAEQLDKAGVIEFDINFFNFEDPEVFNRFTGPEYAKYWKETFGFDWVSRMKNIKVRNDDKLAYDVGAQMVNCLEAELGEYGHDCKRKQGFFKCCATVFDLSQFDDLRVKLYKKKLIKTPYNRICPKDKLKDGTCSFHVATHMCSKLDNLTEKTVTEFRTPSQPKFEVGGLFTDDPEFRGLRTQWCDFLNSCQKPVSMPTFDGNLYQKAIDKTGLCASALAAKEVIYSIQPSKSFLSYVNSTCLEKSINSVFTCEKKNIEHPQAQILTDMINDKLKTLVKETKKKSSKKKNKKKKKKRRAKKNKKSKKKKKHK